MSQLVDRIYESALQPQLWPGVLDDIAAIAEARGAVLFAARKRVLSWTASERLREVFETYLHDGWLFRCTRKACLLSRDHPGFIVENDVWKSEELENNPVYRDFLRPRGLGWSAGTALRMPTGDDLVISIERTYERGPVEPDFIDRLNVLLPHLGRGAFISARLQLERLNGASEALAMLGLPAFVLDHRGFVQATNDLYLDLATHVQSKSRESFIFNDRSAQTKLEDNLRAVEDGTYATVSSFPLRDTSGEASKIVHVLPIRRSARDLFAGSAVMVVLTPVSHPEIPSIDLIRSLFDLSAAESRVARAIALGKSPAEIAEGTGLSLNTIRSQLRSVLEKTGCARQAEIVALLASLTLGRTPLAS